MVLTTGLGKAWLLALLFAGGLIACSDNKDDERQTGPVANTVFPTTAPTTAGSTPAASTTLSLAGNGVYLITPEQLSNALITGLDRRVGWVDEQTGVFFNAITRLLAVPLGGIDFVAASVRDHQPKVQNQLIIRLLAWQTATFIVWRESDPNQPDPKTIFTIANINEDRPLHPNDTQAGAAWVEQVQAGEARWRAQLEDIYWRLLSRPPTEQEVAAIRQAFLDAIVARDWWVASGWSVVLYSLLSSTEFWNL